MSLINITDPSVTVNTGEGGDPVQVEQNTTDIANIQAAQTVQDDAIALNTAKVSNVDHPLVEKAVPANAVFTDTVYDDSALDARVTINDAKVSNVAHPLVEEAVPSGAVFTDTIYDDTAIQAEVDLNTAKTGITVQQANDIATNNSKVSNVDHPLVESAVPLGAIFTDTIYDDSDVLKDTDTLSPVTGVNKIITEADVTGGGDMLKATYDTTGNNIVDNAELVNGLTVETAVPAGALFTDTDTVYDDTAIQAEVDLNTAKVGITAQQASDITTNNAKVSNVSHPLVETAVPSGAVFTDTVYNDAALASRVTDAENAIGTIGNLNTAATDLVEAVNEVKVTADSAAGGGLTPADIDTIAELNSIITDATLIDTTDSRLSDSRDPNAHTHSASEVTDFDTEVSNNASVVANTAKVSNVAHPLVETAVPLGAVFTDTVYDDTTIQSEVDANSAKVGITPQQASDITTNNAKISATGNELEAADIDTLSKLNTTVTDATLIDTGDSRLSDARTPTAHTHTASEVTDFDTEVSNNSAVVANTAKVSYPGDQDLSGLALKTNVLELDNTTPFTPDADHEPATKKYVDDNAGGGGVTDHGALTGLADDDHTQYHNDTRGDARYSQLGHTHTASNITDFDTEVSNNVDVTANTAKISYTDAGKVAGIEAGADVTDATNVNAAGATMNTDTNVSSNSWVVDEDTMSSNDATKVPTQQSVKAYVDNKEVEVNHGATAGTSRPSADRVVWIGSVDPTNKQLGDRWIQTY